ncbi:MAG: SDR family NAD(P)-dependent oxidoreductase [Thainema sp.]
MATHFTGLEIAVVGMVGRFPGASNVTEFWQNLQAGVESVSHFSDEELLAAGTDTETLRHPNYVKARAILDDAEWFDAAFFGLSPRDAEILDPQQRVFLESAWEALETTGYSPQTFPGTIGVYGGATLSGYLFNLYNHRQLTETVGQFPLVLGNGREFLTTRVSYLLNLRGPSLNVQTACSTSLVAVHLASQALLSGECDLALAGGVSIRLPLKGGYWYQDGGISSPDGHCRAFDAKAQGTVGGSGIGLLVLKRLEEAICDRDTIYAVIKGSALNNDGATKMSFTAPRIEGQAEVIQAAQQMAEVESETIQYIEAHGTGTALGDPIEIAALTQAFQTAQTGYCALGAVKTNIGHLDAAAGVAGLIKTILALQHRQIPPSLHFETPNPQIDFAHSPFYVNTQLADWPANGSPRRAGVSSFGMGGTNAHVILEEAPMPLPTSGSRPWQLLLWSAKTDTALESATQQLATRLQEQPDLDLADAAYTLQVGRQGFVHRRMAVCCDRTDAVAALTNLDQRVATQTASDHPPAVVFLFPGQGTQHVGMGRDLYVTEPDFRRIVDDCAEQLLPHLGLDLRQVLYPAADQTEWATAQLQQTAIAQPALFVVEYALARLWQTWGVQPQAMIGHSLGEYVAACLAGVFQLEQVLLLVAQRGRLMEQQPAGAMLSVAQSADQVITYLPESLTLAADNAPNLCVVAGTAAAIEQFQAQLQAQGIACRWLKTSHAFHSPLMDGALAPFRQQLAQVQLNSPQIPWVSNLTGTWITPEQATSPDYWVQHLRQTVRFRTGLQTCCQNNAPLLLEVGPGRTLSTLARQQPQLNSAQTVTSMRHPQTVQANPSGASSPTNPADQSDIACLLTALGQLWLQGVSIDWSGFYAHEQRRRVPLPTYPFERQRYWIDAPQPEQAPASTTPNLTKNSDVANWFYQPTWTRSQLVQPYSSTTTLSDVKSETVEWLLFVDDDPLVNAIAELLRQRVNAITVQIGDHFSCVDEHTYTLNPHRREDYTQLLNALGANRPARVLHGWSFGVADRSDSCLPDNPEIQARGCYSLLFLTQAMAQGGWNHPLQVTVLTSSIFDVIGTESFIPAQATLLGPCTVIPQEYRSITCRVVDWLRSHNHNQSDHLHTLLQDVLADSPERVVAYRQGQRWVQRFEPVALPTAPATQTKLRSSGVYLITGGLGKIGLTLATELAQTYQAQLVLLSRRPFPPRSQWDAVLSTAQSNDATATTIRQLQALEAGGAEVLVLSADVADVEQLQAAIAQAEAQFGPLNGVIHAAGAVGEQAFRLIQETGLAELEQQFRAKVQGVQILAQVLRDKPLDFCLLCSSLASILGGLGFAAYSAANQFMDAFAHQQNRHSTFPWISVNWDGWRFPAQADVQSEADAQSESDDAIGKAIAELALTPEEGVAAWQRILAYTVASQIVVSTADLSARQQQWLDMPAPAVSAPTANQTLYARPSLSGAYVAPRNSVEQAIADVWQSFLGIDRIGVHDSFFELGGHSLLATQIIAHLRQHFQVDIPLRALFDDPTVAGLANAIALAQDQPAMPSIPALPRPDVSTAQHQLEHLDQLSDQDVDDLLRQLTQQLANQPTH